MNNNNKNITYYESLFSQIHRGQDSYKKYKNLSPYKPILLLSIIELIEIGKITKNIITTNASDYFDLKDTFYKYLKILGGDYKHRKGVFHQPFENLRNDRHKETGEQFWYLELKQESLKIEDIKDAEGRNRIKTELKLKELVEYARFDDELWEILEDAESRHYLVDILMHTFFSEERNTQIDDIVNKFNQDAEKQAQGIIEPKDTTKKFRTRKYTVRDSIFSKSILRLYDYKCAVCRLSLKIKPIDSKGYQHIVDAAHIIPYSVTNNNQLSNGISLCKNHHWAFDNGCFGVDGNNYSIIVSNKFFEEYLTTLERLNMVSLKNYQGHKILIPIQEKYRPNPEAFLWHRKKHGI